MSSVLIYKARNYNKRVDKNCTVKNIAHVQYIATRPGVFKEPECSSPLFGCLNQQQLNDIIIDDGVKKIAQVTDSYKTTYRDVISFTSEQAEKLGLSNAKDWKKYIKEQVLVIAKERGIKYENLEWMAAIHNKKGQPHAHIVMWDSSNAVQPNKTNPKLYYQIRRKLIQSTYKAQFQEFFAAQNKGKNVLRADSEELFKGFEEYLSPLHMSSAKASGFVSDKVKLESPNLRSIDILDCDNAEKILKEYLRMRLLVLKQHKGRLAYDYLNPELKGDITDYIKLLLNSNQKLKAIADGYVSSHIEVYKFYSSNEKELKYQTGKYSNMAVKMIANALLQSMKAYQFETTAHSKEAQNKYIAANIAEVFNDLAAITRRNNARRNEYKAIAKGGELSKQAIKELIKQRKDRGLEI